MLADVPVFSRLFDPAAGGFSPDIAQYILTLDFSPAEQARAAELADKAQIGTLTPKERADMDALLTADTVLTILQAKARASLRPPQPSAA